MDTNQSIPQIPVLLYPLGMQHLKTEHSAAIPRDGFKQVCNNMGHFRCWEVEKKHNYKCENNFVCGMISTS